MKMKTVLFSITLLIFICGSINSRPFEFEFEKQNKYLIKPKLGALNIEKKLKNEAECLFCRFAVPLIKDLIKTNHTEFYEEVITSACIDLKLFADDVCRGAISLFKNPVISIIRDTQLSADDLCDVGLNCGNATSPLLVWNITLPDVPKPPVEPLKRPQPNMPQLRILHLTDIHIDFEYQEGSIANCNEPLCCRNSSKPSKAAPRYAGKWGDYNDCDIPLRTLESMFDHISKNEQVNCLFKSIFHKNNKCTLLFIYQV
jgi:sphingomyelin phosphodiesterase